MSEVELGEASEHWLVASREQREEGVQLRTGERAREGVSLGAVADGSVEVQEGVTSVAMVEREEAGGGRLNAS